MSEFKNVTVIKKANIYFEGKVIPLLLESGKVFPGVHAPKILARKRKNTAPSRQHPAHR